MPLVDSKKMLEDARKGGYAIGAFNAENMEMKEKYGYTPDELREYCELYGYNLDELYSPETLQEAYKEHGYEYDIENNTVTRIMKGSPKLSNELLAWLEGKEEDLSAEEKTKKTIEETKALLGKQAEKTGEQK